MQAAAQGLFQYLMQFLQAIDILAIKYKAMNTLNNATKRCAMVCICKFGGGGAAVVGEPSGTVCHVIVCHHSLTQHALTTAMIAFY